MIVRKYISLLLYFLLQMLTTEAEDVIDAQCDTTCNCTQKKVDLAVEFRVICRGNGTQIISLGTSIFDKEPTLDYTRKVYVRIESFSTANISQNFVSKWLAYTSCSFDIWHIKKIVFPRDIDEVKTRSIGIFAGIGIIDSHLDGFPSGLIQQKRTFGIKMSKSKIKHLDIGALVSASSPLNYLTISDTTIGILDSSLESGIPLKHNGKVFPSIKIYDSNIGLVDKGGLDFQKYSELYYKGNATVKIKNSTLGVIAEGAMHFGKGVNFNMIKSNIGVLLPSAISVEDGTYVKIENSTVGVKKDALTGLECGQYSNIFNNSFLPLTDNEDCADDTCEANRLFNFVHKSCKENTLLILEQPGRANGKAKPPGPEYNINLTSRTNQEKSTYSVFLTKETQVVPIGFLYVICGIVLILFVILAILLYFVVFGKYIKSTNSRQKVNNNENTEGNYQDHFELAMPFAPMESRRTSRISMAGGAYSDVPRESYDFDTRY